LEVHLLKKDKEKQPQSARIGRFCGFKKLSKDDPPIKKILPAPPSDGRKRVKGVESKVLIFLSF